MTIVESGFIEFRKERYELNCCKAHCELANPRHATFHVSGPDVSFEFYKFNHPNASDVNAFADYTLHEREDNDLTDSAKFQLYDTSYRLDAPWRITCITAKPEKSVMTFEWEFIVVDETGRLPKKRKMRGAARCSLNPEQ